MWKHIMKATYPIVMTKGKEFIVDSNSKTTSNSTDNYTHIEGYYIVDYTEQPHIYMEETD